MVYFADVRMKAPDNCFVGFPAVWQMPLLVFLVFTPPVWVTICIILALALVQFTGLKFIHPMRTERWRKLNLPVTLAWVVLAGLSVWENFAPPQAVRLGLLAVSLWLLLVGIVMQAFPAQGRFRRSKPGRVHAPGGRGFNFLLVGLEPRAVDLGSKPSSISAASSRFEAANRAMRAASQARGRGASCRAVSGAAASGFRRPTGGCAVRHEPGRRAGPPPTRVEAAKEVGRGRRASRPGR